LATEPAKSSAFSVLLTSLQLGCTSFGGPIAHLGYFERRYVQARRWLSSDEYAGIVALCQMLPGPTSSQVGFLIGLHRAGWRGALAAWIGFTLPSAILLYVFAVFAPRLHGPFMDALLHGLKLAAVAVVAQAVFSMAKKLCPDLRRAGLALLAAAALAVARTASLQLAVLVLGAIAGYYFCRNIPAAPLRLPPGIGAKTAWPAAAVFVVLLIGLPIVSLQMPRSLIAFADIFYRAGALVFGGGHVVLPLLRDALVPASWLSDSAFLAGYGAAQAVPGPLFTLAAYLGAVSAPGEGSALWAAVAVIFIFLPGMLLAVAGLSLWSVVAQGAGARAALAGVNASVVGILGAALYDPVWTVAVRSGGDAALALGGFLLLERWRIAPLLVVLFCVFGAVMGA
jgi:chromate transporter